MVILVTCKNEEDLIKNEDARVLTTLNIDFFNHSRAANSAFKGRIWLKFELIQDVMVILVTSKNEEYLRALLHELKLSLNPKLPLSSRTLLVKMALFFCCIKQFYSTSGATLANDSFKNTLALIFIDKNATGIKLPFS